MEKSTFIFFVSPGIPVTSLCGFISQTENIYGTLCQGLDDMLLLPFWHSYMHMCMCMCFYTHIVHNINTVYNICMYMACVTCPFFYRKCKKIFIILNTTICVWIYKSGALCCHTVTGAECSSGIF